MTDAIALNYEYDSELNIWTRRGSTEKFGYSDGDAAENRLFNIIKSSTDRSISSRQLASGITDWGTLYHLSSARANIIRPVLDHIEGPVLEIGSGCGAITRFLGEQGLDVYAVEGSVRRASIGAERCRDLSNVKVFAESFQNFDAGQKFKTITLIGVLEYARMFYGRTEDGRDPIDVMMERVASFLEPGGKLVIAIENQLGLKYFAGFSEDHLGQPMIGLEDRYTSRTAVTFGKKELGSRMEKAGLVHHDWWYPFPDYKIPVSVLSEHALGEDVPADFSSLIGEACGSDFQAPKVQNFSQELAWKAVTRNGLVGDLANSFLLVASAHAIAQSKVLGYHYGGPRDLAYKKIVKFARDEDGHYVERYRTHPDALPVSPQAGDLKLSLGREPMRRGAMWRGELANLMMRDGWTIEEVSHWTKYWWSAFIRDVKKQRPIDVVETTTLVPGSFFDALPRNLIVDFSGEAHFIDQEWQANKDIEAGYVFFRAMYDALFGVKFCGQPGADTPREFGAIMAGVAARLGISVLAPELTRYVAEESRYQSIVSGRTINIPVGILNNAVPHRVLPNQAVKHLEGALKTREGEIARMLSVSQELQRKVTEVGNIFEAQLNQAQQVIAEKDAEIARLKSELKLGAV